MSRPTVVAHTATVGTGPVTPGAAVAPYLSFSGVPAGVISYALIDGTAWEIGAGTWDGAHLARNPTATSNGGAPIALSGAAAVMIPQIGPVRGLLISSQNVLASGLVTIPAGATAAKAALWGGSGGSGGANRVALGVTGTANQAATGGTGGAGYVEAYLTGLVAGRTLNFQCGAAGTGGAVTPTDGDNGTDSILGSGTQQIVTRVAGGSAGSLNAAANIVSLGTAGGLATGAAGDMLVPGTRGGDGLIGLDSNNDAFMQAGVGGVGVIACGAAGVASISSPTSFPGNPGQPGGMKIDWYS